MNVAKIAIILAIYLTGFAGGQQKFDSSGIISDTPNSWIAQSYENGGSDEQYTIFKPRQAGLQVPHLVLIPKCRRKATIRATTEEPGESLS